MDAGAVAAVVLALEGAAALVVGFTGTAVDVDLTGAAVVVGSLTVVARVLLAAGGALPGTHCEYQVFWTWHVKPETQVLAPDQPWLLDQRPRATRQS